MDKHYEALSKLYLRLKGYWVSNLIIHSEIFGRSKSELDIVAIRMPFHSQEYRFVEVEDYLQCSTSRIEILIAEVKNYTSLENVKFNSGLRTDRAAIKQLIDWLGFYKTVDDDKVDKFEACLNLHRNKTLNGFASFEDVTSVGNFIIKFTFFCPSLPVWNGNGFNYINGQEMIGFLWECFNESRRIATCSRSYNYSNWNEFEPYVRYFKGVSGPATLNGFEAYCKKIIDKIL